MWYQNNHKYNKRKQVNKSKEWKDLTVTRGFIVVRSNEAHSFVPTPLLESHTREFHNHYVNTLLYGGTNLTQAYTKFYDTKRNVES